MSEEQSGQLTMNETNQSEQLAINEANQKELAVNETNDEIAKKIKEQSARNKSGYWQVPNAYFKKIRQLTMNQVREECIKLAASLVDMRNANHVLMQTREHLLEENKKLMEELKALKGTQAQEEQNKEQENVKAE